MCFVLYAGTSVPIPKRKWDKDALCVEPLTDWDSSVKAHFSHPEVVHRLYFKCGCDFPHAMFQDFGGLKSNSSGYWLN